MSDCFLLGLILVLTRSAFSNPGEYVRAFYTDVRTLPAPRVARRGASRGGPSWRDWRPATLSASRRRWLRLGKAASLPLSRRSRRGLRTMLCLLSTFAAPTQPQQCLFSGASVRNHSGARVECNRFAGRQVALYFAGEWCPLCRCLDAELDPTHHASVALATDVTHGCSGASRQRCGSSTRSLSTRPTLSSSRATFPPRRRKLISTAPKASK